MKDGFCNFLQPISKILVEILEYAGETIINGNSAWVLVMTLPNACHISRHKTWYVILHGILRYMMQFRKNSTCPAHTSKPFDD